MTTLTPLVTCEDVRLALNGSYSGSTGDYYFWNVSLSSGSVLAQINLANYYMYGILGESVMSATNSVTSFHLKTAQLDYSCMRVIVLLSGDVITDGFEFTAGITVRQPLLLAAYRNLIQEFKDSAQQHIRVIQPLAVSEDSYGSTYRDTAPSVF